MRLSWRRSRQATRKRRQSRRNSRRFSLASLGRHSTQLSSLSLGRLDSIRSDPIQCNPIQSNSIRADPLGLASLCLLRLHLAFILPPPPSPPASLSLALDSMQTLPRLLYFFPLSSVASTLHTAQCKPCQPPPPASLASSMPGLSAVALGAPTSSGTLAAVPTGSARRRRRSSRQAGTQWAQFSCLALSIASLLGVQWKRHDKCEAESTRGVLLRRRRRRLHARRLPAS